MFERPQGCLQTNLVAGFISPQNVYTFSFIAGNIIPKSVKCIHSATTQNIRNQQVDSLSPRGLSAIRAVAFLPPTLLTKSGLLSNQGEKSMNFYFIRVPLRKKVLKYGTPKPRSLLSLEALPKPQSTMPGMGIRRAEMGSVYGYKKSFP